MIYQKDGVKYGTSLNYRVSNSTEVAPILGIGVEYWGIIIGFTGVVIAVIPLVIPFLEKGVAHQIVKTLPITRQRR